jgi:hypothetical protein
MAGAFLVVAAVLAADGAAAVRIEGKWVLDAEGRPVAATEGRQKGLQTGALAFRKGELLSIGDQRSEWPARPIRIDPKTARLAGGPIETELKEPPGGNPHYGPYRSVPNPDFEGLALDPKDPDVLYGVTEDDEEMWIVRFHLEGFPPRASIDRITAAEFPGVEPYPRQPTNYRIEAIALSDDGGTAYLAWERAADNLPRIFVISRDEAVSGGTVRPKAVPVDFAAVKPRADKPKALLNLNDLVFLRRAGRPFLLGIARDQERILLIDIEAGKVERAVDLDLRAPDGDPIYWASPEGLAVDEASDRLWLITDPDSMSGNYRKLEDAAAEGNFAAMAPLLFETKLSLVLGSARG